MSQEDYRPVPKCSDIAVLKFFDALTDILAFSLPTIYLNGTNQQLTENDENVLTVLRNSSGHSIRAAAAEISLENNPPALVKFERGIARRDNNGQWISEGSIYTDHIRISNPNGVPPNIALKINQTIDNFLISNAVPSIEAPTGERSSLSELVATHHQLITKFTEQIAEVGIKYQKAREDLEEDLAKRRQELIEESKQYTIHLKDDHDKKVSELEFQKNVLSQKEKALDDRHNTHVRRELHRVLREVLQSYKDRFSLTTGTRRLRYPIVATVILIEAACLSLFYILLNQAQPDDNISYIWWGLKGFGLTFLAGATAVWFLKWLSQWSNRHADAEFQLKQLELDMVRASWVVETAFEWKNTQESSIPQPLLDAISRNLFVSGQQRNEESDSPADHLASALLGSASNLKLKLGDHEMGFDRKGLQKAEKTEM